jgi:hypothetical protein
MKTFLLGTFVMIAGIVVLAAGAHAETGVMINITHDFIAGGKALSAGAYKVYQGSPETGQWLILRSKETGASVFLLPSAHDGAFPGQFEAKLTRAMKLFYLSEVVTDLGVYTFPAPHALTQAAQKKDHEKMALSGSNGTKAGPVTE